MLCCLCGRKIEADDKFLKLIAYQLVELGTKAVAFEALMDDGSPEKVCCYLCPVMFGAPRELIGAESGKVDY